MITIDLDPVLLRIGHLEFRWYGVMIVLGILAGAFVILREARRKGMAEAPILDAIPWAILGGLVGARVFHILDFWDYYSANPGLLITLRLDGLAIYGGLVGGVVAVAGYAAWKKLSFWRLADVAAVGLPLGQAIGRVGCLINGCNYGIPTTLPWGVIWTNPGAMAPINDVARHPAQAYEALLSLAVFGLVWLLRKRFKTDGLLFLVYVVAYSLGRFPISLVREDTIALFGLRQAQVVGLALTLLALPVAYYLTRRSAVRLVAEEGLQKP
jgi:phosphatidylglycerol:prolipoprotein diacylglycerol transferase